MPAMMDKNCKITDSIHPDLQDTELICDVFLDEPPKKVYQDCQEKDDTSTEKSKGKRNSGQLLKKLSPLELILFPFQSNKPQAKQVANQKSSTTTCSRQTSSKRDTVEENSPREGSVSKPEKRADAQEETSSSASSEEEAEGSKLEASKEVPSRGRCLSLEVGLWQDRSIVKKRGILSQLSREQLLLQEVLLGMLLLSDVMLWIGSSLFLIRGNGSNKYY